MSIIDIIIIISVILRFDVKLSSRVFLWQLFPMMLMDHAILSTMRNHYSQHARPQSRQTNQLRLIRLPSSEVTPSHCHRAMAQLRTVSIPDIVCNMAGKDPPRKIAEFDSHYIIHFIICFMETVIHIIVIILIILIMLR